MFYCFTKFYVSVVACNLSAQICFLAVIAALYVAMQVLLFAIFVKSVSFSFQAGLPCDTPDQS